MKQLYSIAALCFLILFCNHANANEVVVKGYLKYTDGKPVVNQQVKVSIDSTVNACRQDKVVATDQNGFYKATLSCSTIFPRVTIATANCNGTYLVESPQVPPAGVVEKNFTICLPAPRICEAAFNFQRSTSNALLYHFNSSSSGGINQNDSVVRRRWKFGDGTILEGNDVDPQHFYTLMGSYEVCLTIFTKAGCEKTICKQLIVELPECKAYFRFEPVKDKPLSFIFKSDSSLATSSTDEIVKRKWRFGDGTIVEGNEINVSHTYATKGNYEVCLTIYTKSGCEKTICKQVVAELPTNTECRPEFNFVPATGNYKEIKFNSAATTIASGDVITSRRWLFGDGHEATTIDPVHTFEKDGTYKVCLLIKTQKGCTKELCKYIEIKARKCEAYFSFLIDTITTNSKFNVKFNSSPSSSNDSIVSRYWNFGDGTSATTIDPMHTFTKPGLYNICLVIKTRNGCESQICKQILFGPNASQCATHFTFERLSNKKLRFNSNMSWASVGDTIVERKWNFGDGSPVVTGNVSSVLKEFNRPGTYSVCLTTKTAKGCESKVCVSVKIEDSTNRAETAPIKIVTLYPAPVRNQMTTEVWSLHNNVSATLGVYDIYGVKKWEQHKLLQQGVNVTVVPTSALLPGPYFFKVTSMYGTQSRQFYKL